LEHILGYLSARELATLETTCQYFIHSGITEKVAQHFLKEIPRAKGLKPDFKYVIISMYCIFTDILS
jgi:hypothetical protein